MIYFQILNICVERKSYHFSYGVSTLGATHYIIGAIYSNISNSLLDRYKNHLQANWFAIYRNLVELWQRHSSSCSQQRRRRCKMGRETSRGLSATDIGG